MSATLDTMVSILRAKFKVTKPLEASTNVNDMGLDSLDVINFLYSVEEATGVKIPDEAIASEKLERLEQFAAYVDRNR
jgi:acyl carrier protein